MLPVVDSASSSPSQLRLDNRQRHGGTAKAMHVAVRRAWVFLAALGWTPFSSSCFCQLPSAIQAPRHSCSFRSHLQPSFSRLRMTPSTPLSRIAWPQHAPHAREAVAPKPPSPSQVSPNSMGDPGSTSHGCLLLQVKPASSSRFQARLPPNFRKLLLQLKKLAASGKLTKVKNSYKLLPLSDHSSPSHQAISLSPLSLSLPQAQAERPSHQAISLSLSFSLSLSLPQAQAERPSHHLLSFLPFIKPAPPSAAFGPLPASS